MQWASSQTIHTTTNDDWGDCTYTGQMRGGKRHGFGRASWATGTLKSYDGQWKDDEFHGRGKWVSRIGDRMLYEGQFTENRVQRPVTFLTGPPATP
ncbi:hypothetical protein B484DRAFT_441549 [Ochromonadaceae sp. CCMP2298]|nr:hypothetical protein B484DRAFT_441549 [Ochromonadaceae sp. CCMP2298]